MNKKVINNTSYLNHIYQFFFFVGTLQQIFIGTFQELQMRIRDHLFFHPDKSRDESLICHDTLRAHSLFYQDNSDDPPLFYEDSGVDPSILCYDCQCLGQTADIENSDSY